MSIHENCLLVSLHVKSWGGKRTDRKVTKTVHEEANAQHKAGVYVKNLVDPKTSGLFAVQEIAAASRAWHYAHTAPWGERGGDRIVTIAGINAWAKNMRGFRDQHQSAVENFLNKYPDAMAEAEVWLGKLHSKADYPTIADLTARFALHADYKPVPHGDDFRADLPTAEREAIIATVEEANIRRIKDAMDDTLDRVATQLEHVTERLRAFQITGPGSRNKGVFHDTLVSNTYNMLQAVEALNITGDAELTRRVSDMQWVMRGISAQNLREDQATRDTVAAHAAKHATAIRERLAA